MHRRSKGFALLAALGFLAVLFIIISALDNSVLFSLSHCKQQQQNRQAVEISRTAAMQYVLTGAHDLKIEEYQSRISAESAATTQQATQDVFEVLVEGKGVKMRTSWRKAVDGEQKRVILVGRGEM